MTVMKDDDIKLDASNPQGLLEYIQRLKAENARLESRSRLGLNFENTPDENVVRYSTRVPLSVHESGNDVMTDDNGITHDLIIGDNYPGLLTLLPKYEGRINVIYIDPPYNTGNNDFIYNDRYTNPEDSYKHSKWLSFMEPRLRLAKRLLSDDGAIFVSIDDHEQSRLKLLMDGIFGERNSMGVVTVVNNLKGRSDSRYFATAHEYLIGYAAGPEFVLKGFPISERMRSEYKHEDEKGRYKLIPLKKTGSDSLREDSPSLYYPIYYNPTNGTIGITGDADSVEILPTIKGVDGRWRWSRSKVVNEASELEVMRTHDVYQIFTKMRLDVHGRERTTSAKTVWLDRRYDTGSGGRMIGSILGDNRAFSSPKPLEYIKDILRISSNGDSIILDFFAGSGTTGQAVTELNAEDGGHRHCILITDEGRSVDDPNAVNIARDITYTRLQRVLTGQDWADGREHPSLHQNLRTHHLTDVSVMKHDGINKRATDDVLMDIIDVLYHGEHGDDVLVDYAAYLDADYLSSARAILNSWRNAVTE